MIWLPDTNFWIEILKRPDGPAAGRFRQCQSGDLRTSVIVWAALLHGARKYGLPEKRRQIIHQLLRPPFPLHFPIVRFPAPDPPASLKQFDLDAQNRFTDKLGN